MPGALTDHVIGLPTGEGFAVDTLGSEGWIGDLSSLRSPIKLFNCSLIK